MLSLPHLIQSAPEYQTVKGLKPNLERSITFVEIEPNTGYPLRGYKRAQFNMFVHKVDKIDITRNLKTFLMPIIWVEEGAELNEQMVQLLNSKLFTPLMLANILIYTSVATGIIILLVIGLWQLRTFCTKKKEKEVKVVIIYPRY